MEFTISNRARKTTIAMVALGFIATAIGFFSQKEYLHADIKDEHTLSVAYHHEVSAEEVEALKTSLVEKAAHHNVTVEVSDAPSHGHDDAHEAHGFNWLVTAKMDGFDAHGHGQEHSAAETVNHLFHSGEVALVDHHYKRFWSNLMVNGFFFFSIALGALFFFALTYATETAWSIILKRVFESVMMTLAYGGVILIIIFIAGSLGIHHIYHWMDPDVMNPDSPHYDALIAGKQAYLNQPFFWIRTLVYFAVFFLFMRGFRKRSLMEDEAIGSENKIHFKQYARAALFLVLFGYLSSVMSWDWIMSIDTHWFSTLFGWYTFSGIWISGMLTVLFTTLYLKRKGYLPSVNQSHIHDLGKWVFAISFLWSYLWFSQFMLIWYSNIPEEVTYYITRIEDYKGLFFGVFMVNFILPMLFLMSRESKRAYGVLMTIGVIIFVGHWLDVFLMIMPGTVFSHWSMGLLEIGMFVMFLGGFIYLLLNNLTKAPLEPQSGPYLDESKHHEI